MILVLFIIFTVLSAFELIIVVFVSNKYYKLFILSKGVYKLQNEWLLNCISEKKLSIYFKHNNYKKVGIVGCNKVSFLLWRELSKEGIEVVFCTDKIPHRLEPIPGLPIILESDIRNNVGEIDVLVDTRIENNKYFYKKYVNNSDFDIPQVNISNVIFYVSEL